MSLTKLLIAAVILCGLGGLIWWANKHPQESTTSASATTKILSVPDAQIQSVEIRKKDSTGLTLSKDKGKWQITAPQTYAADQDAVTSMVSSLSDVTAESVIEEHPKNPATFGLTNPDVTVTAHEKDGKTAEIYLGDDVPGSSEIYARVGKDPKVYSVSSSIKSSFNKTVNDLRDKRLLTFDSSQVSLLELTDPKSLIAFGKLNQSDWQILKPGPYRADSFQVDDLLRKLTDAKMDLNGKPEDAKAAETGFNTGKPISIAKVTSPAGTQTLDVRENKDNYYAQSSVVPGTFKIANDLGQLLAKPLDDFRNKKLFDFGFSDTNRIEMHTASGDKTFVRSGTDWKSNGQTMDAGQVQSLIDKLRDLSSTSFVTTGFNNADIAITVVSNDSKRTEKVELSKTADGYIARREGQPALYKLDAKSVDDILEAEKAIKATASGAKK